MQRMCAGGDQRRGEDVFGHVGMLRFNVMEDMSATKIENVETTANKIVLVKKGKMKPTSHPTPAAE